MPCWMVEYAVSRHPGLRGARKALGSRPIIGMHPGRAQALIRPDAARGLLPSTPPNPPMTPDSKFGAAAEVEARHEAEAGSLDRFAVFRREVLYCPARDLPLAAARSN